MAVALVKPEAGDMRKFGQKPARDPHTQSTRRRAMKRVGAMLGLAVPILVILMLVSTPAWAVESVAGRIQAVDATGRMILLDDGTQLVIPPDVHVSREQLMEGAKVKATYEIAGTQKVVRSIQVEVAR
jgi:hypothetical protein